MVTKGSISDCSNSVSSDVNNEDGQDTISVATTNDSEEEEEEECGSSDNKNNQLALVEDVNRDRPCFGNVAVTNSTDVHFGNKTYYQGPVTIKQFLYANPQISIDDVSDSGGDGEGKLAIKSNDYVVDNVPENTGIDNPVFLSDVTAIKSNIDKKIVTNGNAHQPQEASKGTQWLHSISRQHLLVIISLVAVLLISLVTLMVVLLTRHQTSANSLDVLGKPLSQESDESQLSRPAEYPDDPNVNVTLPKKVKILSRQEWLAQPASQSINKLHHPVPYVIIMHTATDNCTDVGACVFRVRYIQSFHIDSRGWWDIGYNFLVGGDGNAYEGRGWLNEGAHTYGYNTRSIGIAFIGTFNQYLPSEDQMKAAKQLIQIGVDKGYIATNYKLLAARQLQKTQSPGLMLYEEMKKWPHWSASP